MANRKLTLTEATMLLVGTQIGAGILGLPYAMRKTGVIGILIVIGMGIITLITALMIYDSIDDRDLTLSELAEIHIGKWAGWLTFFSIMFYAYGAEVAYISGVSSLIKDILNIPVIITSVIFTFLMFYLLMFDLKISGEAENALGILLISSLTLAIAIVLPKVSLQHLSQFSMPDFIPLIGVAMFAYASHLVVPEIHRANKEVGRKAVIYGYLIPMIFYSLFGLAFVGAYGSHVPTLALNAIRNIKPLEGIISVAIPLLSITTSFIGIALSQKHNIRKAFNLSSVEALILSTAPPLLIYIGGLRGFVKAISLAGSFGAIIFAGIIPTLIYIKRHRKNLHIAYSLLALFMGVFIISLII